MTKEEIFEKYGDVPLKFAYYYKYTFTFIGESEDGCKVITSYGGDSSDIYRFDVSRDKEITLNNFEADNCIIKKDNKTIFEFDDRN